MRPAPRCLAATLLLAAAALVARATPLAAQQTEPQASPEQLRRQLRESQDRLDQIRKERGDLQRQMEELRSRVHDANSELSNIGRQVDASASALKEIDFQQQAVSANVATTTRQLLLTRDRLQERNAVLHQRLRSIYERGPLNSVRVMLSAESFGDLLNRYKYLQLITVYDRLLVNEVRKLEGDLVAQNDTLNQSLAQLDRLREQKLEEFTQLQVLQQEQMRTLSRYKGRVRQTQGRLAQLARDEARLTDALADLERRRREDERRRAVAGAPPSPDRGLPTRALGALAWPVDGDVIYRFGADRKPNGVVLRNNGIGIAARAGTPVRAVEAGTVVMARPFEGYGPTVMISHGGGYYTLYLYLASIGVSAGQRVLTGQTIGTVGGEHTADGAHIEFQVRAPIQGGDVPEPMDPLDWLRARGTR